MPEFIPVERQTNNLRDAAAALGDANQLIERLTTTPTADIQTLIFKLELAQKTLRGVLRERARMEARNAAAAAHELQAAAILAEHPETDDPERNGTVAVGAATGNESHGRA